MFKISPLATPSTGVTGDFLASHRGKSLGNENFEFREGRVIGRRRGVRGARIDRPWEKVLNPPHYPATQRIMHLHLVERPALAKRSRQRRATTAAAVDRGRSSALGEISNKHP